MMQSEKQRFEYDLLHKTRINWSNGMMTWRNIVIPVSLTLIAVSAGLNIGFWIIGWLLGAFLLIFWRFIENHIDHQIRDLYPRIVELEEELNITFFSHYLWSNFNRKKNILEYQNGTYNYKGIRDNLDCLGSRVQQYNMWFVTLYFISGVIAFYGYYYNYLWHFGIVAIILATFIGFLWKKL